MQPNNPIHGAIPRTSNQTGYLFRVSLKAVIFNPEGQMLLVKESGRDLWDIPGGGLNHSESIHQALARELHEEVSYTGEFTYEAILTEDPVYLHTQNWYQIRLTFLVIPENFNFEVGEDGDEIQFADYRQFKDSSIATERRLYEYGELASKH